MFKFEDGILKIQKVEVPKVDVNIMGDLQESYRQYISDTVHEDMQYLMEELRSYIGMEDLELVTRVGSLQAQTYMKTQVKNGKYFYPVLGYFKRRGMKITTEWELLRIPYMDDYGKINVDGASKVVLMIQRAAEDISYTMKNNMFNIAMPHANIRIYGSSKWVKMAYGKYRYHMHDIIAAMLWAAGDKTRMSDIFTNTFLLNAMKLDSLVDYQYVYQDVVNNTRRSNTVKDSDLLSRLKSSQYRLGSTRDALNETLTLDRAVGKTLSRDVLSYKAGTPITKEMVQEFKRNRVNIIHVQNTSVPTGYFLATQAPIIITQIPKGMKNCELLRRRFPQYASALYIPEDIHLDIGEAIVIANNTELTSDQIELLIHGGYTSLNVTAGNSKKIIRFSFEREIVGNYTARLGELTTDIPAGRSADEWVYYYNNPSLEPSNPEYLTCHDFIGIVSMMGEIMLTGKSALLDRDTSFLKKVMLIDDVFSETLRSTIKEFVTKYHSNIANHIQDTNSTNPFWSLTSKWISKMNDERYLAPADTVNLSAEVSQVCHVNTILPSSSEVVDEQRHLSMLFYGRICPYETPAGKKLGLVNTKAIGARIKNGLLYTPYRKVLPTANGIRISNKVTWLSVKDELGNKFGDILSLKQDSSGNYLNTPVLARIPNPDISDEPFIFKNIKAFDLANGYVFAVPELFLSPTATLIPFAGSDDPVRISYGLSQIRQSVYLAKSERTRVQTSMYKDIFGYSDSVKYMSPCDGQVISINNMLAVIRGNDGKEHTVQMQGHSHIGRLDATVELHVTPGQMVSEGECIAEAHKYPQPFVVRAPYDGKIVDISDTAITIERGAADSPYVNLDNADTIAIQNGRIMGQSAVFMNLHVSVGDRVHKGQILADTCASRDGYYSPSRNPLVAYMCWGTNYEDGVTATERASVNYTSIIAHKVTATVSKHHYKYTRANKVGGFKYCGPGDRIGSITMRSSISDEKGYQQAVRASTKAHGIPIEVNTVDDDAHSRTYAYHVLGFNKLGAGDKMSGRHGNKGVVSEVMPDSKAPQLKNGKTIEFCLNPCGVPSRMNFGQIYDAHLGLVATVLNVYIESNSFNGATLDEINYLMRYTWLLANTPAIGDNVTGVYNKAAFDATCSAFPELPKEFHEAVWCNIKNIIDWRGVFDPDGSAELYDPETDTFFEGRVTIGYPMYNKLMQEADEKINCRAGLLEEQYARTTSQPQKGVDSAKGQRMAEMELMALAAMGCSAFIDEILNEKSDNTGRRANAHLKQLGLDARVDSKSCYSRSVENLMYLLEACGVKLDVPKEIVDVSHTASVGKYCVDVPRLVKEQLKFIGNSKVEKKDTVADFEDMPD